ncbi:glycosyltransferase family 4 protein [Streptomyces ovatisporus]|uniref:D-inositol 3-phosphate glycosyltransferase n=1 Tax=Streptomyces ovatisporus TaxID=1128682 RepID=A0ABV9AA09_9ACTN
MPGDVDDPASPSGGNAYDRRMCRELAAAGRPVSEAALPGGWPRPAPAARAALARELAGLPDGAVVLVDGLLACGVPEIVVPETRRLRVAVLMHLPLADETGLDPDLAAQLEELEGRTLRAVRAVVTTSDWAARDVCRRHGVDPGRVHTVCPGTDPAPLARGTDGASRLLCVAAVTPRKGQADLARALAEVADLPFSCEFVGSLDRDPRYTEELRGVVRRSGLGDRVRLSGPLTGRPLAEAYDAADLFVLASHAETYGMVFTEALSRGIPVLATAAGAVRDTVGAAPDGSVPGILVPPGDGDALAGALRSWLTEPTIRRLVTTSARRRRDGLQGWPGASHRLDEVLESLRGEQPDVPESSAPPGREARHEDRRTP